MESQSEIRQSAVASSSRPMDADQEIDGSPAGASGGSSPLIGTFQSNLFTSPGALRDPRIRGGQNPRQNSNAIPGPGVIAMMSKPAKMLDLNHKRELNHTMLEQWRDNIKISLNQDPTLQLMEWITPKAQTYLDIRFRSYYGEKKAWRTWPPDKLFSTMSLVWPKDMDHTADHSLETRFRLLQPKIEICQAVENANSWTTQIEMAVQEEVEKKGAPIPPEREATLIKILLEKLPADGTVLGYIRTEVEKEGRAKTIEQFVDKVMNAAKTLLSCYHVAGLSGYNLTKRGADTQDDHEQQDKRRRNTNKSRNAHDNVNVNANPAAVSSKTICNGCGRFHAGTCRMASHPDFNKTSLPWHESASGKAYFTRGITSLPTKPPFLDATATWEPPNTWGRAETNSNQFRPRFQRTRGGRGRGAPLCSITKKLENRKVLMRPIAVLFPTRHRRQVQALIDTGSPGDYISPAFSEWLQRGGYNTEPHAECICSPLDHDACRCSKNKILVNLSCTESSDEGISISAAEMPLAAYDLILGYPTIAKHNLLHKLGITQANMINTRTEDIPHDDTQTKTPQGRGPNVLEHTFLGALLSTQSTTSTEQFTHVSDLLDGTGDDGDDITDLFNIEAPWDRDINNNSLVQDSSPDAMIDLIEIHGSPTLKQNIRNLCKKYSHCFSQSVREQPAKVAPLHLDVDLDLWEMPRNAGPPRQQSDLKQEEIKRQIDKLLTLGVIRPSQAPYYSHPHLAKKPDGSWRFCIDYRQLNYASKSLGWPIPNIELLLRRVGKNKPKYFGKFDLTSAYHQTEIDEESRPLTAFMTAFGVYEWVRSPFGLKGLPAFFQRAMQTEVLSDLQYNICETYLDDVLTWGQNEEEFLHRLDIILQRFSSVGLTINPKKCSLGLQQVEYTGHVLDSSGLSFSTEKKAKVVDFVKPRTQKELKSFLGLANYFRNHIQNHSLIVQPLHAMVKDYKPRSVLLWTPATDKAFEEVKSAINLCPKLHFVNEQSPIFLHTDASDYGIGAYLFQVVDGVPQPIQFLSQTFKAEQKRWSTADKECYAIVYALKHLEHLIRDRYFVLRTDHKNLTYLNLENSGKVRRWKLLIQEYNFGIEHIDGESNFVADDFSRLIPHIRVGVSNEMFTSSVVTTETNVALPDPAAGDTVEVGAIEVDNTWNNTSITNEEGVDIFAPIVEVDHIPQDKYKLISAVHNSIVGHKGVDVTIERLREQGLSWPYMRGHVILFITKKCTVCQKLAVNKLVTSTQPFTLSSYDVMQRVAVDSTGILPLDANGNKYIVSIIDHFSRFIELYAVDDLSARDFAKCLLDWIGRYGAPRELVSDQGTQFANKIIEELSRMVGSSQAFTMRGSKQENGIVERSIKEIRRHLRAIIFSTNLMDNWSTYLPLVQRILNADVKEALGVSPAQILFGNSIQLDRGVFLPHVPNTTETLSEWMSKMLKAQAEIIHTARLHLNGRDERHMSQSHTEPTSFPVNSYVLVSYDKQPPTTLHTPQMGPLRVVSNIDGKYTLQNLVTLELGEYHVSRLRPFYYEGEDVPRQTANRDTQQWDVDSIIDHAGDLNRRKELKFRVRWLGYDETFDTWEPYSHLRHNAKLHDYLRTNKLKRLIPRDDK